MKETNKGGNKDLHGKYWACPNYVINCINNAVKT